MINEKIQISKHKVAEALEKIDYTKKDLREALGLTEQALYYRYKKGWRYPDALFLALTLATDINK